MHIRGCKYRGLLLEVCGYWAWMCSDRLTCLLTCLRTPVSSRSTQFVHKANKRCHTLFRRTAVDLCGSAGKVSCRPAAVCRPDYMRINMGICGEQVSCILHPESSFAWPSAGLTVSHAGQGRADLFPPCWRTLRTAACPPWTHGQLGFASGGSGLHKICHQSEHILGLGSLPQ